MAIVVKISDKKDWKKVFKRRELKQIEVIFNQHFLRNADNGVDENVDYLDNLKQNRTVVHADTGIWDDTCGIRPKQVKKALDVVDMKYLLYVLDYIQSEFNSLNNKYEYEEHSDMHNFTFYDFNEFFKSISFTEKKIISHRKSAKKRIKDEIEAAKIRDFNLSLESIRYGKEFYDNLSSKEQSFIFENFLSTKKIDSGILFSYAKEKWKEVQGFIPQVNELLVIDPTVWDKNSFLFSLNKLYKTRQFHSLSEEDRKNFIDLYFIFGNDLSDIPFDLVGKKSDFFFNSLMLNEKGTNKAFKRILQNYSKGIVPNFSLTDLALFNYILSNNKKISKKFENRKEIFMKDLNSLVSIGEFTDKIKEAGYSHLIPYLMTTPEDSLKNIFKLNYSEILRLFEENKENKQIIPTASFKIKDYEFEVIDKKDIRGYICGYPFSCQYIGGLGDRFTRYGYTNEDSSFMIVSKQGVIVAQSWIWKKDNQITFDSIEWKGGLSSEIVAEGYKKYADILFSSFKDLKIVTVGNCRDIFTKKIDKFTKLVNTPAGHCYDSERQYLVSKR